MTIKQSIPAIFALVCILILPVHASARKHSRHNDAVELEIISDYRGSLREFAVPTDRAKISRSYVIAKDNEPYRIRITNRSNRRIGVVVAVDGRNIISGKKSHLESNERMYVLNPHQTEEFDGWRTGRNRTNRFYFTNMDDSYAADWGDYTAMGVVAIAAFDEREQRISRKKHNKMMKNKGSHKSKGMENGPGTGFGEERWSPSREVNFVAQNRAKAKQFIKYEYRSSLCRKGIVQCKPRRRHRENRFWPHTSSNEGFAPFPSWHFNLRF